MEWKGRYLGHTEKIGNTNGKAWKMNIFKMNVAGAEQKFSSFNFPPILKDAEGKIITVGVTQNGNYFNLDESFEIKVEEQTQLQKQEEKKMTEEQQGEKLSLVSGTLSQTMLDAKGIVDKTFSPEELKAIGPEKRAELIASMGMHLSNNFHR